jgi:hypothetical protein
VIAVSRVGLVAALARSTAVLTCVLVAASADDVRRRLVRSFDSWILECAAIALDKNARDDDLCRTSDALRMVVR